MTIRLYSPFNRLIGSDVLRIELQKKTSFKKIIPKLIRDYPQFKSFIPEDLTDEKLSKSFVVFKEGRHLGLDEEIEEEDELTLLFPLLGG